MTREELEQALYKLQSDISSETERYIESKGQLIRLPMQSRNNPILALIDTYAQAKVEERQSMLLSSKKVIFTEEEVRAKVLEARIEELKTHGGQWEAFQDEPDETVKVQDVIGWYKVRIKELQAEKAGDAS